MQQYAKAGGGEQMRVARATMGLFWASDFVDDENRSPAMVGLSPPPPPPEALNAELNI